MTVRLTEVIDYLDSTLEIGRFRDSGPSGLQVEGSHEVDRVITAVSANAALFERARPRADAIALTAEFVSVPSPL